MHLRQLGYAPALAALISGLPFGTPPSRAFTSAPRTSSARARRRFVVGPYPGRTRPTAPRSASVANVASLIRSRTMTWKCSPTGVTRADAGPGAASATTAAAKAASTAGRRARSAITSHSHRSLFADDGLARTILCVFLDQLLEARRAFERGEARGLLEPLLTTAARDPPPAGGRHRRRGADEAADEEVPRSPRSSLRVHGTIVPCES